MIKFLTNIYKSQYFRNLFVLSGGVGFSQLIPLILLPVLTRFFSPEDFGLFALFMAIIQLLAISTTLRLENPLTNNLLLTTLRGSDSNPILAVPTG